MNAVKESLLEIAAQLPADCTWDDVMERLYVRMKIEDGLRDAEQGRTIDHDEVFREYADDADPMD